MSIAHLPERCVIKIAGEDARTFLDGLVTNDMALVTHDQAGFGALLTPQGKIIVDFFMVALDDEDGGGFLLDTSTAFGPDLLKKLSLYKLRRKVIIEDLGETAAVIASSDGGRLPPDCGVVYADPRLAGMGDRAIVDRNELPGLISAAIEDYHSHRICLGIPDGGKDFAYGGTATFPHEALMDQLGGVSFSKGCYVGQEVVSRMQHRGSARTRLVPIVFTGGFRSEWGVEVKAGDRSIGSVGSTARDRGIAMVRLDKVAEALTADEPIRAGGLEIALVKPPFIHFPFPGEAGFGESAA
ncbi:MAG: folate-binding protein [Hyphomicrobiales bacterium]|nr:folate-binding protein [Hyphomicrobiales bacterium]